MASIDDVLNDPYNNLIGFVKGAGHEFYSIWPVEYWMGIWWEGYLRLSSEADIESEYVKFLFTENVSVEDLKKAAPFARTSQQRYQEYSLKPTVLLDFDSKRLITSFSEQALENSVRKGWSGHRVVSLDEYIPEQFIYW